MEQNMNIPTAGELSDAALAALAFLAGLADADRGAVLQAHGLALGPRLWRVQDGHSLPSLSRLVEERDRERIFESSVWRQAYRPGRKLVLYILQGVGLAALSAALGGVGIAKVGTAELENVDRRIRDLGESEYGAWTRGERSYLHSLGFGKFVPATGLQLAPQHPASPVRLGLYGIEIGLPAGLSAGRFEAEINARLLPLRLQSLANSDTGRTLCARAHVDPAALRRFYKFGRRYRAATELTLLRPRADSTALAKVAADIAINHVLGLLPQRSGR